LKHWRTESTETSSAEGKHGGEWLQVLEPLETLDRIVFRQISQDEDETPRTHSSKRAEQWGFASVEHDNDKALSHHNG
jgi:hypothetical protein